MPDHRHHHPTVRMRSPPVWGGSCVDMTSRRSQISSLGRFRNKYGKVFVPRPDAHGYCRVKVHGKLRLVHRIVAECFLPRRESPDQIHVVHIDATKHNNRADNLRWVSPSENTMATSSEPRRCIGSRLAKAVKARRVGEAEWTRRFESSCDAARQLGVSSASVGECCKQQRASSAGFEFEFDDPANPPNLPDEEWRYFGHGVSVSSLGRRRNDGSGIVSWGSERQRGGVVTMVGGRSLQINRMVAEAFGLPRAPGQTRVNHVDGNVFNNRVENLRWGTHKDVARKCNVVDRVSNAEQLSQSVEVLRDDEVVALYSSMTEAAVALGLHATHISACLAGRQKTTGGYRFRKADADAEEEEIWVDVPETTG